MSDPKETAIWGIALSFLAAVGTRAAGLWARRSELLLAAKQREEYRLQAILTRDREQLRADLRAATEETKKLRERNHELELESIKLQDQVRHLSEKVEEMTQTAGRLSGELKRVSAELIAARQKVAESTRG